MALIYELMVDWGANGFGTGQLGTNPCSEDVEKQHCL